MSEVSAGETAGLCPICIGSGVLPDRVRECSRHNTSAFLEDSEQPRHSRHRCCCSGSLNTWGEEKGKVRHADPQILQSPNTSHEGHHNIPEVSGFPRPEVGLVKIRRGPWRTTTRPVPQTLPKFGIRWCHIW